jgi:hypothetical protein
LGVRFQTKNGLVLLNQFLGPARLLYAEGLEEKVGFIVPGSL